MNKSLLSKQVCPYCYKPSIDGLTHFKCKKKYGIDGLLSVWQHDGVVRKAIMSLKYKYATQVGKELSEYFYLEVVRIKASLPNFDVVTAVPLYWYKQNVRGFNQSDEFAKQLCKNMNWYFEKDVLVRNKNTETQTKLNREGRVNNLKGAFAINKTIEFSNIKSILVIDDVFTTGVTLKECSKVLKSVGIQNVWGMTLARRGLF